MGRKKELYPKGTFHLRDNQGTNENKNIRFIFDITMIGN